MAVKSNPQRNLPLDDKNLHVSLPHQAQAEAIASLAELIAQLWSVNHLLDNLQEDRIDE